MKSIGLFDYKKVKKFRKVLSECRGTFRIPELNVHVTIVAEYEDRGMMFCAADAFKQFGYTKQQAQILIAGICMLPDMKGREEEMSLTIIVDDGKLSVDCLTAPIFFWAGSNSPNKDIAKGMSAITESMLEESNEDYCSTQVH